MHPPPSSTPYIDFMLAVTSCEACRLDRLCGVLKRPSSAKIALLSRTNVVAESDSIVFGGTSIPKLLFWACKCYIVFYKIDGGLSREHGRNKEIEGSVPSQQPEAIAFVTDHYGSMKTQAAQEHNRVHNARKHEKVERHSSAGMSTAKVVIIYKTTNVSKLLGRKGPLLGTYLVPTVSCPLEGPPPPPQKIKTLHGSVRVTIPRIIKSAI